MTKPSRTVRRVTCPGCDQKFRPPRADARYCSGACRQRVHRDRAKLTGLEQEIRACRVRYWRLVAQFARAKGLDVSQVVTGEAQFVDEVGNVTMYGEHVGRIEPDRPGWAAWGLEAAGPPWSPPQRVAR